MICQLVSDWLFDRPIKLLEVPIPIFLWSSAGIFSELIGECYSTLLPGLFFVGTMGLSTGFLFSIHCRNSYIHGYQIVAHCHLQPIGVFQTYTRCSSIRTEQPLYL